MKLVRFYRVINLVNYKCQVVEKVVAKKLSLYCENHSKLYVGQIRDQKKRSAIDTIASFIYIVQRK